MTEELLNMMRQWLDKLEQGQDRVDPDQAREHIRSDPCDGMNTSQKQADLLYRLTRQNEKFCRFAEQLLIMDRDRQGLDASSVLEAYSQHLDQLSLDWIIHSWALPEQLASALMLPKQFPEPSEHGLTQAIERAHQLLAALEASITPALLRPLHGILAQLQAFDHARTNYQSQLALINKTSIEHLHLSLETTEVSDIDTLHGLWIDSYEHAYRQHSVKPEYEEAFGCLCNTAMSLRNAWQQQLDQLYQTAGLVTLTQYDELSAQHHALRRRVRYLENQVEQLNNIDTPKGSHAAD